MTKQVAGRRPRTLRVRLTLSLLALLAVTCAGVGVAVNIGVRSILISGLDQQLATTGNRFAASVEHRAQADPAGRSLETATGARAEGMLGAWRTGDALRAAAVVVPDGVVLVTSHDVLAQLATLPADGRPHTVDLRGLGSYRAAAAPDAGGDALITGLPLDPVKQSLHQLAMLIAAVSAAALGLAGLTGALWTRRSLQPLREVARTALGVTRLPLHTGEVALPEPVTARATGSEVQQVSEALNLMLGHVQDALSQRQISQERLRSFAADASHELRTPVASIRGHAELALRHPDEIPPPVVRSLERIAAESARMGSMVDDLLLLARLDSGRQLSREVVDMTKLLLDAVEDAQAAGAEHRWVLDVPPSPVALAGDRLRLHQAVANLLANARSHTPAGTRVVIRLRSEAGSVTVAVDDDGPGIPDELQTRLFERFTRGDHRHPEGAGHGGAGLGLSIVAAVVAGHHGIVTVDSTPDGTTFTITLPDTSQDGSAP